MAKKRALETLVVPGHPQYDPAVFDRLAEQFIREEAVSGCAGFRMRETAESAHLKPEDGVMQNDGWDNDCC